MDYLLLHENATSRTNGSSVRRYVELKSPAFPYTSGGDTTAKDADSRRRQCSTNASCRTHAVTRQTMG